MVQSETVLSITFHTLVYGEKSGIEFVCKKDTESCFI